MIVTKQIYEKILNKQKLKQASVTFLDKRVVIQNLKFLAENLRHNFFEF